MDFSGTVIFKSPNQWDCSHLFLQTRGWHPRGLSTSTGSVTSGDHLVATDTGVWPRSLFCVVFLWAFSIPASEESPALSLLSVGPGQVASFHPCSKLTTSPPLHQPASWGLFRSCMFPPLPWLQLFTILPINSQLYRRFRSPEIRNLRCCSLLTPSPVTSLPYVSGSHPS